MGLRKPDGLRVALSDGKEVGQADIAPPFFSGLMSLDPDGEGPVEGGPEGLKPFHGPHSPQIEARPISPS